MSKTFLRGEPNLVNEHIDIISDTSLSLLKFLSLPTTLLVTDQTPTTPFATNFPNNIDDRYCETPGTSIPLRLDWNTFLAPPSLFGQQLESNRIQNWALNRLQFRHDIHKDIQEQNIQTLKQHNLTLKFEITVKIKN